MLTKKKNKRERNTRVAALHTTHQSTAGCRAFLVMIDGGGGGGGGVGGGGTRVGPRSSKDSLRGHMLLVVAIESKLREQGD